MISKEHKIHLERALEELEERFDPGKSVKWKWKNNHQRLELYNWKFATENQEEIVEWLERHNYECNTQFNRLGGSWNTIYLKTPLSKELRTLFSLTWS